MRINQKQRIEQERKFFSFLLPMYNKCSTVWRWVQNWIRDEPIPCKSEMPPVWSCSSFQTITFMSVAEWTLHSSITGSKMTRARINLFFMPFVLLWLRIIIYFIFWSTEELFYVSNIFIFMFNISKAFENWKGKLHNSAKWFLLVKGLDWSKAGSAAGLFSLTKDSSLVLACVVIGQPEKYSLDSRKSTGISLCLLQDTGRKH